MAAVNLTSGQSNFVIQHMANTISTAFNLHLDIPSAITTTFNDILVSFDLKQHVTFLTHIHGHWLDFFITSSTYYNIQTSTVSDGLSDHHTVIVDVNVSRTKLESKHNVFYRHIHKINIAALKADILKSDLIIKPKGHLSDLCGQYYQVLKSLLNKHAICITKATRSMDDSRNCTI